MICQNKICRRVALVASLPLVVTCMVAQSAVPDDLATAVPSITVTVSPKRAAVVTVGQTQQFTASVQSPTWGVDGLAGGNSTVGTISGSGLYTPPATAGNHTVTATSGTSSGSAT